MKKIELCGILGCSETTLNRRLNSSKQYEREMFAVLLNFNRDELITRIYQGYEVERIDLNMNLNESANFPVVC